MRGVSLKRLLMFGVGASLGAVVLLTGGWLLTLGRFEQMKQRLYTDAVSLQAALALESSVNAAYQSHLLWRATGNRNERIAALSHWDDAAQIVGTLPGNVTSPQERVLVQRIENRLAELIELERTTVRGSSERSEALRKSTESLRMIVREHRALNDVQMRRTAEAGTRLEIQVRWVSLAIIILAAGALAWSAMHLWTRLFRPIFELSRASREFGKGHSDVRAPILWDDEMGDLSRTFNDMAQSIAEREKERLDFVATVAHDLKSPLMVVAAAAEMLRNKSQPTEKEVQWLQAIERNTHEMEGTISDLTDGVQTQTGRLQLERENLDLALLAREITAQFEHSGISNVLQFNANGPAFINGDQARLRRVIYNLISNARKYSAAESVVRIVVEQHSDVVTLRVEDEGIGIAPEDVASVFAPFSRLEQARSMAAGNGLGLSSARTIIEAHGGIIRLMSQPNHGTVVEVRLPRIQHNFTERTP